MGLRTRRSFVGAGITAVGVALLGTSLAACSSDSDEADPTDATATPDTATTETTTTETTTTETTTTETTTTAATTTDETTTTAAPTSFTATHAYGTVEIPAAPARVVAMENRRDLETAVVLGLPLVAVGTYGSADNVAASFVPVDLAGVEIISLGEINLEQLVGLEPDLILAREIYLDDGPGLFEVAPVLPIKSDGPWREDLERVAGWLHREATLASALDQYDALLADVRGRHADRLTTASVAIVEFYPADSTFYAGGLDDFQLQANTLRELGGRLIPFLTDRSYFDEPFSVENLDQLDGADAILLVVGSAADRDALDTLELWQRVPAVAGGRVVTTDVRTNQGSVYAATECLRLLDELYSTIG